MDNNSTSNKIYQHSVPMSERSMTYMYHLSLYTVSALIVSYDSYYNCIWSIRQRQRNYLICKIECQSMSDNPHGQGINCANIGLDSKLLSRNSCRSLFRSQGSGFSCFEIQNLFTRRRPLSISTSARYF